MNLPIPIRFIKPSSTVPMHSHTQALAAPAWHTTDATPAIAGLTPFSSIDWPGFLSTVIFIGGCPWRCSYCHNPHLQQRHAAHRWEDVCELLRQRKGLIDGVVFSGGEPLSEVRLPAMIEQIKSMGFKVALHTAGIYPVRLAKVLPLLDWVGFDVKTNAEHHSALTGRVRSNIPAEVSLEILLMAADCKFECRTTWSPAWQSEADLLKMASQLSSRGVKHYAVQYARTDSVFTAPILLTEDTQRALSDMFEQFSVRTH